MIGAGQEKEASDPDQKDGPLVSVIVVLYNALPYLSKFVAALANQTYRNLEIIAVDNASSDGSAAFIARVIPGATVIRLPANRGFADGNNAALPSCHGMYLALLNPDTEPEPTWLATLVAALEADPAIGLATSKIILTNDRTRINTCGNAVHIAGFATCRGLNAPATQYTEPEDVAAVSGAAFIIRRALMERLGGFDASFFMYVEDTDLSWRAILLGARCRIVPASVVAHRYALTLDAEKTFYLERNRMQMLLKCYRARTLLLLAPALLLGEVAAWGYAALQGPAHLRAKANAARWVFHHRRDIRERRRTVQASRVVGDCALLSLATSQLPIALLQSGRGARIATVCAALPFMLSRHAVLALERPSPAHSR
ncbi:MAG: glycosyltransferase family 2 protein [Thermomicrobiales bacterium]